MELGIFAKTFMRPSVEEVLDAVKAYELGAVQFNMSCTGLPSMPDIIENDLAHIIGRKFKESSVQMSAVSGTFNMAHPDENHRNTGIGRLRVLAEACSVMGTSVITLCTGTRDTVNMWRRHPDNNSKDAWRDMVNTMAQALQIAEDYNITLAIEPELSNIINDAHRARILLEEMTSQHLKIVMDAANLYDPENKNSMNFVLDHAFELLGENIVIAHAKDIIADGDSEFVAAGKGLIDYDHYLSLLRGCNFNGALILHGLDETQVEESVKFLRQKMHCCGIGGESNAIF